MLYELYDPDNLRITLQEYLTTYAYSNASWNDFVDIMAKNKPAELDIEPKE